MLRPYITLPFISNSWSGGAPIVTPHQLWHHLFQHVGHSWPMLAEPLAHPLTHPLARPLTYPRPPTHHLPSLARWPTHPIGPSLTPHPDTQPLLYAGRTPILHTTPRRLAVLICRPPAQPSLTPQHPAFFVCRPCTCPSLAPVQAWRGSSKPAGNTRFA